MVSLHLLAHRRGGGPCLSPGPSPAPRTSLRRSTPHRAGVRLSGRCWPTTSSRAAGPRAGPCAERSLSPLERPIPTRLDAHRAVVGMGYVAAPGVVAGPGPVPAVVAAARADDLARLRLNFDPASVDVYDYLEMEWFRDAERAGPTTPSARTSTTPAPGRYVVTASVPVVVGRRSSGWPARTSPCAQLESRTDRDPAHRGDRGRAGQPRAAGAGSQHGSLGASAPSCPRRPGPATGVLRGGRRARRSRLAGRRVGPSGPDLSTMWPGMATP